MHRLVLSKFQRGEPRAIVLAVAAVLVVTSLVVAGFAGQGSPETLDYPTAPAAEEVTSRQHGRKPLPSLCRGRSTDGIFSWLEDAMVRSGVQSWGHVLDAGTGAGSFCWLLRQQCRSITAVTVTRLGRYGGDELVEASKATRTNVSVVIGNWQDPGLLRGREFDVVVADYLLGAVDQYWPYGEDAMADRVLESVRKGGHLVFVGLEPYDQVLDPKHAQDALVLEIEGLGDAAAILAGGRTYRELPQSWVVRQITRLGHFRVVDSREFPMQLSSKSLHTQLDFAASNAKKITDAGVRSALLSRIERLGTEASSFKNHRRAKNYAFIARRES